MAGILGIRFLKATPTKWEEVNPILLQGQPGYEKGTGKVKIGDGITEWNKLKYFGEYHEGGISLYNADLEKWVTITVVGDPPRIEMNIVEEEEEE
jgi:hypothetical protein